MDKNLLYGIAGAAVIVLGAENMKGNISTLHRYHRERVSEEDRIPFGRKVGAGTMIVGSALLLKACSRFAAEKLGSSLPDKVGTAVLAAGQAAGFAMIFNAMSRYNKGIF